jgi:hypothetical protein
MATNKLRFFLISTASHLGNRKRGQGWNTTQVHTNLLWNSKWKGQERKNDHEEFMGACQSRIGNNVNRPHYQ